MKKQRGRPKGSRSTYAPRNKLTALQIRKSFIPDYSKMNNQQLCAKYRISLSQLRTIVKDYSLKSKSLITMVGDRRNLEALFNKGGSYAIVRLDYQKALIGSSSDIGASIQEHILQLDKGTHCNTELQAEWGEYEFFFAVISKVEKDHLCDYVLYGGGTPENPLQKSKLFEFLEDIKQMRSEGLSYRQIAEKLPIEVTDPTIFNFCSKMRC